MSFVPPRRIRPLAICVAKWGESLLLMEGTDSVKGETFYRPLGGEIEFGESAIDAVRREWREELDAELGDLRLLGVLENRYVYEGHAGHEIVLVFETDGVDPRLYRAESHAIADGGRAVWIPLDDFRDGALLYPEGILSLIDATRFQS